MKIALVHEMLVKLGGAERVIKKLSDMFPEAPIYTLVQNEAKIAPWFERKKIITSSLQKWYRLQGSHRILLPWMAQAIESFDFSDYDLVISSSSAFAHGIKLKPHTRHICYCHSPMRYAWDYTHEYLKGSNFLSRFLGNIVLHKIRLWDLETSSSPTKILANSCHVQKRIQKYWRKCSEVVYPPVDISRFKPTKNHQHYFLIISALTPFKKIDLAIRAFNKDGHRLIIIGQGPDYFRLKTMAKSNIELLGYKPDEVVKEYLENCRALIFPGEEDFGIVPIEAMTAGKPVLAYGKGGCLETIKGGINGELFHEATAENLRNGLHLLINNEKKYDPFTIKKSAEQFSEKVFEKNIQQSIKQVMN